MRTRQWKDTRSASARSKTRLGERRAIASWRKWLETELVCRRTVYLLRYYIMWTNNWLIHLGIIMTCNETIVSLKLLKINDIFVYYKHLNKWLNRISLSEGKDVYYKSLNIFYKSDSSPLHKKSIFEKVVACLISRNKWNKNINELLFQLWFPMMYFKYLLVPKGKQDNYF